MKRFALLLGLIAVAGAVAWERHDATPLPPPAPAAAPTIGMTPTAASPASSSKPVTAQNILGQHLQAFAQHAKSMDENQRKQTAAQLDDEVKQRAARKEISGGESALAQLALLRIAYFDDPAEEAHQEQVLKDSLHAQSAQQEQAYQQQLANDPRYQAYKASEAQIAAQVMTMPTIPNGLTRDEFLRQQLQAAREQAYHP